MFTQVAIAGLNHVLEQCTWAREKLKPHAGRVALLRSQPLVLRLSIEADGHVAEAASDSPADADKKFGLTRERIRQIEGRALRRLRHPRRSRQLRDYLVD